MKASRFTNESKSFFPWKHKTDTNENIHKFANHIIIKRLRQNSIYKMHVYSILKFTVPQ
jgi:hypothetical protein